jgi:hypothetical protein
MKLTTHMHRATLLAACLLPAWAAAQSRIDQVLVFPGGAQVI